MPTEIRELLVRATLKPAPTTLELEERIAQLEKCIEMLGDKITVQAGGSSVTVSSMGVAITGREVTINATGKLVLKSAGEVVIKGAKIAQN